MEINLQYDFFIELKCIHDSGYDKIAQLLLDNGAEINSSIMVDTTIGLNMDNKTVYSVPIHLDRTTAIHFAAFEGFIKHFNFEYLELNLYILNLSRS